MKRVPYGWLHLGVIAIMMSITTAIAPDPWYVTDRGTYQEIGGAVIVRDCSSLHCSRILVPSVLEQLPGPSVPKWKAYAAILNTWSAAAVASFALAIGLSPRAALIAMWMTAMGFGALFTLFDPYSADPLMFVLGPLLARWLVEGRYRTAGLASAIGVFAKEFAAAPLWIWTGASLLARRWHEAARVGVLALAATVLWTLLQATLIVGFNNNYGGNRSADLFGGGYITLWFGELGWRAGLLAIFTEYGPLHVLAPAGLLLAPPELRRIAIASVPAAAAFLYVQQPDRAMWNFHFIATPLAAVVLARVPLPLGLAVVVTFAAANLRLAAQLLFLPAARYVLAVSVFMACVAALLAWRTRPAPAADVPRPAPIDFPRSYRALLGATAVVAMLVAIVLADVAVHRAIETEHGLNQHGYRGAIARGKTDDEIRIVLVGGATVFSPDERHAQSTAKVLSNYLQQHWRWMTPQRDFRNTTVVDLSLPNQTAATAGEALRDYERVRPDIVVIVTGQNDLLGARPSTHGRRDSFLFRSFGYLPALPSRLRGDPLVPPAPAVQANLAWIHAHQDKANKPLPADSCKTPWSTYCDAVADAVDYSVSHGRRVLVVTEPYISGEHYAQQRALAGMLAHRYSSNPGVTYRDLGWILNQLDSSLAIDGWKLRASGIEAFADGLVTSLIPIVSAS